jgi:hypothetical protein
MAARPTTSSELAALTRPQLLKLAGSLDLTTLPTLKVGVRAHGRWSRALTVLRCPTHRRPT